MGNGMLGVSWQDAARSLGVSLLVGVFLALGGAFGTEAQPLVVRLAYWIPMMVVGGLWGGLCGRWLGRRFDLQAQPWAAAAAMTAAISGPLTIAIWVLSGLFFHQRILLAELPGFLAPVIVVTAAVCILNVFLFRPQPGAAPAPAPVRFLARLPHRLRGAVIHAVESADHYLRVHTDQGSDLILMRLSDAIDELQGLEGAQTHRSWWVARGAVIGVSRGDGRATLQLKGGVAAPVSRSYAPALREAGWY